MRFKLTSLKNEDTGISKSKFERARLRSNHRRYGKSLAVIMAAFLLVASMNISGCSWLQDLLPELDKTEQTESAGGSNHSTRIRQTTAEPSLTPTPEPQKLFMNQTKHLSGQGITLPRKQPTDNVTQQELIDILAQVYELIAGEIDTSSMNPDYGTSEGIRKLTNVGIYYVDSNYSYNQDPQTDITYSDASYWIFEVRKKLLEEAVARDDDFAYAADLLHPINISSSLYGWNLEATIATIFSLEELVDSEIINTEDEPLTRQAAAHMMVKAYESITGTEIPTYRQNRLQDTPDIESLKATNFFFWPEDEAFMPDLKGKWDDDYFLGTYSFDSQLSEDINGFEKHCPYGAVISAITTLLDTSDDIEVVPVQSLVVLNERPYPWHIYQIETGEYGDVNCMPSCIEMSMLYQGLDYVPSAESLRGIYPLDGLGWTDIMAEELMLEYGLEFFDDYIESYESSIDDMIYYLDQGNILYIMFRDEYADEGHAVIIKGYRQTGEVIEFIISDPNQTQIGPYGYPEYLEDADKMIEDIIRHVPRYFIIPPGSLDN